MGGSRIIFFLLIVCYCTAVSVGQSPTLRESLERISQKARGTVGVAITHLEDGDTISLRGQQHCPMQSVYKFPLALAILHLVDEHTLSLDQLISVKRHEMHKETWSPLSDSLPNRSFRIPLRDLIRFAVTHSDNNACDILFRLAGGPLAVNTYIHGLGIRDIAIVATEGQMHRAWNVQYGNWCTPIAMRALLKMFFENTMLSQTSHDFLRSCMLATSTGPKRLRAGLPAGTALADKTGTSGTNDAGVAAATNDVGIVTLPNGTHLAIVVFVTDAKAPMDVREETIAGIAKSAFDYFSLKK